MLFNSHIFILLFLPISLITFYVLGRYNNPKRSVIGLFVLSMVFYAYNKPVYLLILLFSLIVNWGIYSWLNATQDNYRKMILMLGVAINIGLLGYFKYVDFIIANVNYFCKTECSQIGVALPLGISFYTFQQIAFIVDAYKGKVKNVDFGEYVTFVTFFPQLIAGPIARQDDLVQQIRKSAKTGLNWENLYKGLIMFSLGLTKKVVIADAWGKGVNYSMQYLKEMNLWLALLTMIAYTFEIYFDFSGYCDMASGLAKMFNIDLPVNFNLPYRAKSVREFWQRWHMTLTSFLTEYVYIPLGGSQKGRIRTYVNVMIVFAISGLWHGASWTFVLWGILHGMATVIERMIGEDKLRKVPLIIRWCGTFIFINVTWMIFKIETFEDVRVYFHAFLNSNRSPVSSTIIEVGYCPYYVQQIVYRLGFDPMVFVLFGVMISLFLAVKINTKEFVDNLYKKKISVVICSAILIWCVLNFNTESVFLYFNF